MFEWINSLKRKPVWYGAIVFLMASTYLTIFLPERFVDLFSREDGIFEWGTAVLLFFAGVLLTYVLIKMRASANPPHFLYQLSQVGLVVFFFLSTGEEISWGQRLFNIETPEALSEVNVQDEITLHNLQYFQGDEAVLPVTMEQIFIFILLMLGFGIPLGAALLPFVRKWIENIFPLFSYRLGTLIIVNYGLQKIMMRLLAANPDWFSHSVYDHSVFIYEIREFDYALAIFIVVLYYAAQQISKINEQVADKRT